MAGLQGKFLPVAPFAVWEPSPQPDPDSPALATLLGADHRGAIAGAAWFPLRTAHRLRLAPGLAESLLWAETAACRFAGSITRLGGDGGFFREDSYYAALQAPSGPACTCFAQFSSEDCTGNCSLRVGSEATPGMAPIAGFPGDLDLAPCCDHRCEITNQELLRQCGFQVQGPLGPYQCPHSMCRRHRYRNHSGPS